MSVNTHEGEKFETLKKLIMRNHNVASYYCFEETRCGGCNMLRNPDNKWSMGFTHVKCITSALKQIDYRVSRVSQNSQHPHGKVLVFDGACIWAISTKWMFTRLSLRDLDLQKVIDGLGAT